MHIDRKMWLACLGLIGCCALALPQVIAQQNWISLGLHNESISVLVVKDGPPTTIFAGSASDFSAGKKGAVFRTTNEGITWDTLLRGFSVDCIVVPSSSLDTIFVGTGTANSSVSGILRTIDGGKNWLWSHEGIYLDWETGVNSIAFEPSTPDIMYASTGGFNGGGLYKSLNMGGTWQLLNPPSDNSYTSILVLPGGTGRLLVGTVGRGKVLRSTNRGETWSTALDKLNYVHSLISNSTGEITFAGFQSPEGTPLAISIDAGATWAETSVSDTLRKAVVSIATDLTNPTSVFALTTGKSVVPRIFKGHDGAMAWEQLPSPANLPYVLQCGPPAGALYVGCQKMDTTIGGVFRLDAPTEVPDLSKEMARMQLCTFPNPFNSEVTITLDLERRSQVQIDIFDICGRAIWRFHRSELDAGRHEWTWLAKYESTGLYFCRASVEARMIIQRLLLIR